MTASVAPAHLLDTIGMTCRCESLADLFSWGTTVIEAVLEVLCPGFCVPCVVNVLIACPNEIFR
jgi:uncharacterized protein YmfQ (DUF2313 family)